jgi:hypothetical protein
MIQQLRLSLLAWNPDGKPLSGEQLASALSANVSRFVVGGSGTKWESARISAFTILHEAYKAEDQPSEAFENAMLAGFIDFSTWLATLASNACDALRAHGMKLAVLIDFWMDQDQMDLELPPELLIQLGRLRLPLQLVSND